MSTRRSLSLASSACVALLAVACAKDKAKSWDDWMQRGVAPAAAECDTTALTRNREFGQKYNITGTPTLIFSDGTRAPGAIPAAQVEKQLAALD